MKTEHGVARDWLVKLFAVIITGLLRVLVPLALFSLFAFMILEWIVEDIWRWLRGTKLRPVLLEGGYAETGLRSRDPESRGLDPRAGHIFSLEKVLVWGGLVGMVLLFFLTLHLQQDIVQYIP